MTLTPQPLEVIREWKKKKDQQVKKALITKHIIHIITKKRVLKTMRRMSICRTSVG